MEHVSLLQTNSGICGGISLAGQMPSGASLTLNPQDVRIGDPPMGVPFPGTTWIGDFPPPSIVQPAPGVLPPSIMVPTVIPNTVTPVGDFGSTIVPSLGLGQLAGINPWSVLWHHDRIVARCDVPGVKSDVDVSITNGSITVSYKRFDTGGICHPSAQFIGTDYDPTTAGATLEAGVLTVTVMRFKEKMAHKVPVTVR